MLIRYQNYLRHVHTKRKLFSEVQKRVIACRQNYKCQGRLCRDQPFAYLPETWELDHIIPLFDGGSNDYNFYNIPNYSKKNNLQIICPTCHADKTQKERMRFFELERHYKFNQENKAQSSSCLSFVPAKKFYRFVSQDEYCEKKDMSSHPKVAKSPFVFQHKSCTKDTPLYIKKRQKRAYCSKLT